MRFFTYLFFSLFLIMPRLVQAQTYLLLPYKIFPELPASFLLNRPFHFEDSVTLKTKINNLAERFIQNDEAHADFIDLSSSFADKVNQFYDPESSLQQSILNEAPILTDFGGLKIGDGLIPAINHFSGKEEALQQALNIFSEVKNGSKFLSDLKGKNNEKNKEKNSRQMIFSIGMIRPTIPGYAFDLYPAVGFISRNGPGFQLGIVQRISASAEGSYLFAHRAAFTWYFNPGFLVLLDVENLRYKFRGNVNSQTHLISSLKKTVPVYRSLSSFLQISFDWGEPQPSDGYADRLSYQAGIQIQLSIR